MANILLIDDDEDFSEFLCEELRARGYDVDYADNPKSGLERLPDEKLDVILLDNKMPGMTGLEVLEVLKEEGIKTPVIMMTLQGTSDTNIIAILKGAFAYIEKGLEIVEFVDRLEPIILRILAIPPRPPATDAPEATPAGQLIGKCPAMCEVYRLIGQVSETDNGVLIQGETGTGKELVAQAIVTNSRRKDKPFVPLNVATLQTNLLESELFGHVKGAFTGAVETVKGYFEQTDGGTLFLDEIAEMPYTAQAKLLRVVENQEVIRLGGEKNPIKVDVRLISATHQDMEKAIREKTFRADLYYRLNVFPIQLPPLRERGSDLQLLGRHFLVLEASKAKKPVPTLHRSAIEAARDHSWPGNVRELKFRISRAVLRCVGGIIMPEDLGLPAKGEEDPSNALRDAVARAWDSGAKELWPKLRDDLECELLRRALAKCGGNQTQVAERLGMARNTVRKGMQKYGLD